MSAIAEIGQSTEVLERQLRANNGHNSVCDLLHILLGLGVLVH
jgi:hypothetical protein